MAGLGRKTFIATEVLTAANVNGYLMDQSVMKFADSTARSSAIGTAVSEGMVSYLADTDALEVYNGTSWGAVSSSSSGNAIINGGFDIWQRGTSITGATVSAFLADRWLNQIDATATVSRQTFTPGTAPVAGYEGAYYHRIAKSSGGSYWTMSTRIEDVRTFAGQSVTLSYWGKAATSETVVVNVAQEFGSGGSSAVYALDTTASFTTSWQRFTHTFNMPSIAGKTIGSSPNVWVALQQGGSAAHTIDIWGMQLEAGSSATPFKRNGSSIQAELANCMRYFQRRKVGGASYGLGMVIAWRSSTAGVSPVSFQTAMRTSPSVSFGGDLSGFYGNSSTAITGLSPVYGGGSDAGYLGGDTNVAVASGPSNGQAGWMQAGDTGSAFVEFSSEL